MDHHVSRLGDKIDFGAIFNDSFERILGVDSDKDHFFELFYEIFLSSSEKVAEKFKNTDMERQKVVLQSSLYHMMHFAHTRESNDYMEDLADSHLKVRKVEPELYDLWQDAMLEALRECDPGYNRHVALAWRVVLAPGVAFMKYNGDY